MPDCCANRWPPRWVYQRPLDNCEHLVPSCAELSAALLRSCPDLAILATSREPLGTEGETVWSLPPLTIPAVAPRSPKDILEAAAVQLFVDRARCTADVRSANRTWAQWPRYAT